MARKDIAKNPYESKYNLMKYFSFFVVGIVIFALLYLFRDKIYGLLRFEPKEITLIVLFFILLSISAIIHIFWVSKHFDTRSIYRYLRNVLHTNVTMTDAAYIKRIFDPEYVSANSWVTLEGVLHLPENLRRKAALDAAKKILSQPQKPVKKPTATKPATTAKHKTTTAQKPKPTTKPATTKK